MDCRKYGTVIVILAMVLLAGCGRNSSEEKPVTPIVTVVHLFTENRKHNHKSVR